MCLSANPKDEGLFRSGQSVGADGFAVESSAVAFSSGRERGAAEEQRSHFRPTLEQISLRPVVLPVNEDFFWVLFRKAEVQHEYSLPKGHGLVSEFKAFTIPQQEPFKQTPLSTIEDKFYRRDLPV